MPRLELERAPSNLGFDVIPSERLIVLILATETGVAGGHLDLGEFARSRLPTVCGPCLP